MRIRFLVLALVLTTVATHAQESRVPTFDQLIELKRPGAAAISPDGTKVAFTVNETNWEDNAYETEIFLADAKGGTPIQLTRARKSSSAPAWSPDGKWIAFTSEVYPDCASDDCNKRREQQTADSKVKAKVADRLLYRRWNFWKEGKRTHVFIAPSGGGEARDVTPGDYDAPPFSLGGPIDYAFSPDSQELAFARNTDKVEAISTNNDIFVTPVAGGEARRITGDNPASDQSPQYSPDGRYLAYRAQARPGFEADRWRLELYDRKTGQGHSVTDQLDSSVESFTFSRDGQKLYFVAGERGRQPIYEMAVSGGPIRKLINDGFNDDVSVAPDGRSLVFTRHSLTRPIEIFRAVTDGTGVAQLTKTNEAALAEFALKAAEDVTWEGAAGARMHGFLVKPANFTSARKWPLVVLIHGGPQGAWSDSWSYRWNPQVFAAAGYVVFMPNPRGSTGYGQKFVDEISGDWGGKVYTDIMNGVAQIAALPYIDRDRIGAAGASYGGYMVNWILGHNDDPRFKFKALVSHDGVYNLTAMYGGTEELWFVEWEFKGTPWTNAEMYSKWSPHMYVKNFKTPTLVVHGELDYRVPVGEGLQLFTALQRQGVESKLLYFPDEGHWVLKPLNSELWYNTVLEWLDGHLKPKGQT